MCSLLRIDNLSVSFISGSLKNRALGGISFALETGKSLGIAGESGSGKSVTALSIMGLLPLSGTIESGRILFSPPGREPKDLVFLKQQEYKRIRGSEISMVFQEPMTSLNPSMVCGRQVSEVIRHHMRLTARGARDRTLELFEEVSLPRVKDIYNSYPHQLSGGQKQRVMIAMAMSCNPKILIADEPTTALDVTVQKSILRLIKKIQERHGTAIIFISHDLGVLNEIADDLIVLRNGEIVESGQKEHILRNPQNPYTCGLLACRPRLDRKQGRLPTIDDFFRDGSTDRPGADVMKPVVPGPGIPEDQPVLQLRHVKTYFKQRRQLFRPGKGAVKAVDDISLDVYPGETLGLVGESGCGKTTLGRTILRLVDSTSGTILYKGKDITRIGRGSRWFRRSVQIIFQDPYASLNPRLKAGPAIIEPLKAHRLGRNSAELKVRALQLLERVGLGEEYFHRYPHELSGGQRQRIVIARALAVKPEFLVCDESVSALDVSVQAQVLNLLNDLKQEYGFTLIFISHDLAVVKHMSDRLVVMKDGRIAEMGDASEIYRNPAEPYTRKLIEAILGTWHF